MHFLMCSFECCFFFLFFFCNASLLQHTNKLNNVSKGKLKRAGRRCPTYDGNNKLLTCRTGRVYVSCTSIPHHRHQQHLNGET